jgi:hypothetical protein
LKTLRSQRKKCARSPRFHHLIDRIIAETRRYSQRLETCPALRGVSCGFFAASPSIAGRFLCRSATVANGGAVMRRS